MPGLVAVRRWLACAVLALCLAGPALAVEYPLQYAPPGDFKGLVVAGYQIVGKTVIGNCSYTQITSGSGRDPRTSYTPIPQTCTWDLYGNLLSTVSGAPTIPVPLTTKGTETIYAKLSPLVYTGVDSALGIGGFVFTYGANYQWLTSNAYMVLPQKPYTFTATLGSMGDVPLKVRNVRAFTALAQTKVKIDSTTCTGEIPVGATCDVTVTYNDANLTSPSGLAYDQLTIHIASNDGESHDFVQRYTDEVVIPPDGGDLRRQ